MERFAKVVNDFRICILKMNYSDNFSVKFSFLVQLHLTSTLLVSMDTAWASTHKLFRAGEAAVQMLFKITVLKNLQENTCARDL